MSQPWWLGVALLALLALLCGVALGWRLRARRGLAELVARADAAQRQLKEESARMGERLAAAEVRAAKDVAAVQAEMLARIDRLSADHRAETEKLARHLSEAYDELDKLRVRVAAAGDHRPPDTGQGFPATMPMGDL